MAEARRILIGVTGGIAAYKIPALVRLLRKSGREVKVALTPAAKSLVGVEALRTLSGNPVYLDGEFQYDMDHIRLSQWADLFIICPATANTIAKMAGGIADNLLTTLALSIPEERTVVAPAMNSVMWGNKATQANIGILADRGVNVLPVGDGELACGDFGPGRMLGIEEIARCALSFYDESPLLSASFNKRGDRREKRAQGLLSATRQETASLLRGKSVLISSGPTEEPIDPVRVITNKSSGKMGAALARAAYLLGARVTVVSGPATEPLPECVKAIPVKTAAEMAAKMAEGFASADICVMAAAVSDYRPVNPSDTKLRREENESVSIELTPNPDILATLGASKTNQFLVGFALENGNDIDRAEEKMRKKNCDMMVANNVGEALGTNATRFTLIFADGARASFPIMDKQEAATAILSMAAIAIEEKGG
ncbi:MAG: bifunctional phosphopantothenoylcysteine decarboxylase/phosphopantothenate synthase [Chitinispirillales bacterium]|jgi:phosphopantothenoylcysteine decarboxylase/phosphopantothenate--cysteine ligase|nr:bifunctional phosphopantothenoylcysteine decarboxylase/phosphopantothenate synthase [Chitinispirillales bacterium]